MKSTEKLRILLLFVVFWVVSTNVLKGNNETVSTIQHVTLSETNVSLIQLLWKMKQQTDVVFAYSTDDIENVVISSLHVTNEPVFKVMCKSLENTDLECEMVEGVIVIKKADAALVQQQQKQQQAQVFAVKGQVKGEDGEPLIGVAILLKGSTRGVTTDLDGNFVFDGVNSGDILIVSYIGKETTEEKVVRGRNILNLILSDKASVLDDVVITGYQTISKERATGSYAIISSKNLEKNTETNILGLIEGLVPGMSKNSSWSNDIRIRGTTSLNASKNPLYIVDGIPYEGNLDLINPNDIANITVLKDAAAASIYGASAANGVIVITTRKGEVGKTRVSYNGSIHFSGVPSLDHLNLISSEELVEFKRTAFNTITPSGYSLKNSFLAQAKEIRQFTDPVVEALVAHDQGRMSEADLNERLLYYSSLDNRKQIYDAFSRTSVKHQHNLSVHGGGKKYKYYVSMNYLQDNPHDKFKSSKQYGLNTKNEFVIGSKVTAFVNVSTSVIASKTNNYRSASYSGLLFSNPSYQMLKDDYGKPLPFPSYGKSQFEIDRLISIGLLDQTYYPQEDMHKSTNENKTNYLRVQGGFKWKIIDGLSASAIIQQETNHNKSKTHYRLTSHFMRNNINNAAQINPITKEIKYNIPLGGRLNEIRSDNKTYTIRGQLDFNKVFCKDHTIVALAGAERRARRSTSSSMVLLGYTENGMANTAYDPVALSMIFGTESINGYFYESSLKNGVSDSENRYVSFYGNASYSYKERYDVSSSVRVDESNLFARTTGNKWKPIWSVGAGWHILKEPFMNSLSWFDRLTLRLTYGIGGNMATDASAFAIIYALSTDRITKGSPAYISEPANPQLSWETTTTTNVGLDFAIWRSRITGSIDYYKKHTTDLLGEKQSDPTVGWNDKLINYGKMDNKGIEIALNAAVVLSKKIRWNCGWIFGYNKNKLIEVNGTEFTRNMYLYMPEVLVVGKPLQSIYSPRYAKLSNKGMPLFYTKENNIVEFNDLTADDLVYVGTTEPKYNMSLINSLEYKNFELSFKLVYYGGHVFRDQRQKVVSGYERDNFNRISLNFWKKPGDELDPSKSPAIDPQGSSLWNIGWLTKDSNTKKAYYMKLRNINLLYRVPKSFLNQFRIEEMSLAFQIDNLLTWAANRNIDPESFHNEHNGGNNYFQRSKPVFSFSVNLNF